MADKEKMPNMETRVGQGKVRMAHYGRDSIGLKMKTEDRAKLLKSGAKDIVEGQRKAARNKLPKPPKVALFKKGTVKKKKMKPRLKDR
jgi:hypothetical protein